MTYPNASLMAAVAFAMTLLVFASVGTLTAITLLYGQSRVSTMTGATVNASDQARGSPMDDDETECPECKGVFDVDNGDCENQCLAYLEQQKTEQSIMDSEKATFARKYYA